jgi:hypothetical protein
VLSFSRKSEVEENRVSRLQRVVDYVQKNEHVGTFWSNSPWIRGEADVAMVRFSESRVIFFFGRQDGVGFGLGGSMSHVVGLKRGSDSGVTYSFLPSLLESIGDRWDSLDAETPQMRGIILDAGRSSEAWPQVIHGYSRSRSQFNVRMRVEFLARRLLSASYQGELVTLATPLYVAQAG